MNDKNKWEELIDRHLRGELNESDKEHLAEFLDSDAAARKAFVEQVEWDTRFAEALRAEHASIGEVQAGAELVELATRPPARVWFSGSSFNKSLLATSAVIIIALVFVLYSGRANTELKVARITGLSGSLAWIGDGGRIVRDLSVGTELSGGTIEGMAPDSWFELEFEDHTTVMISGTSVLTFSDDGQKKFHLKQGTFSANVMPQQPGKPMLLNTRTAALEVLGTQFNVDAGLYSTTLNVSEGKVRVRRLSDEKSVVVRAGYRVVAAPDQEMTLAPVPDSISEWTSQLHLGAGHGGLGRWSPATSEEGAQLRAVPFITPTGKTIYTASIGVSVGDNPPVVLQPDSTIRVRGYLKSSHRLFIGVTVRHANGDFAGRFQTIRPADEFQSGQGFEIDLQLGDFRLDPSLNAIRSRLPEDPYGLIVESIWGHTLFDPTGLAITEMQLSALVDRTDD
jgi:ferric-dicitrate binding protein FerR (iron transport regulator)